MFIKNIYVFFQIYMYFNRPEGQTIFYTTYKYLETWTKFRFKISSVNSASYSVIDAHTPTYSENTYESYWRPKGDFVMSLCRVRLPLSGGRVWQAYSYSIKERMGPSGDTGASACLLLEAFSVTNEKPDLFFFFNSLGLEVLYV